MFKIESSVKSLLKKHLETEGFEVLEEFRVPEGNRVDILAIQNDKRYGIEIKTQARGLSDDISKGTTLHKLPEFDYFYVAAPNILISNDLINYAKTVRIGVIGIEEEGIKWIQESELLHLSELSGGTSLPQEIISAGDSFEIKRHVSVYGEKVVRNPEMFFIPSGPFTIFPKSKSRFKRKNLRPGDPPWEETFKIRVKKSSKEGTYPLYIACTATDVQPSQSVFYIRVKKSSA